MLHTVNGNIFTDPAKYLVNPVNCVGTMGKGLASAFADRWPEILPPYKKACAAKELNFVVLNVVPIENGSRFVINLPTKYDWRENSHPAKVGKSIIALFQYMNQHKIKEIAVPALGCGEGRMSFKILHEMIEFLDDDNPSHTIRLYRPK